MAKELLAQSGQNVLGLVINGAIAANEPYSYFTVTPELEESDTAGLFDVPRPASDVEPDPGTTPTITPVPPQLVPTVDTQALEQMSMEDLQHTVDSLHTSWEQAARLVNEQEEELMLQRQAVANLQQQLKGHQAQSSSATGGFAEYEHLSQELQLSEEQERLRLLEETLVGQRRGLRHQQDIYRRHLEIWQRRQQYWQAEQAHATNGAGHRTNQQL